MNALLIFIIGLAVGSFLNVVILRLHGGGGFVRGRSSCPHCKKVIAWYDNIPLVSFIMLRGRCRWCNAQISWQYPLVELCTAVLFTVIWYFYGGLSVILPDFRFQISDFRLLRDLFFVSVLIIIFVYDLRWYIIPDAVTLPAIVVAAAINIWLGIGWMSLLTAAVIGGGFFLVQFVISRGRWIGGGDMRLGALMGCMLGFPQVLVALFIAYVTGAIVGLGLVVFGRKEFSGQVPFGTFLSTATLISMLYGQSLLTWYLGLL